MPLVDHAKLHFSWGIQNKKSHFYWGIKRKNHIFIGEQKYKCTSMLFFITFPLP